MSNSISKAFLTFNEKAPKHAAAWSEMIQKLSAANVLDTKTTSLIYLAVLAAQGMESGIPFHVQIAKQNGAGLDEIISAVLVGLPACGHKVTVVLPAIVDAFN